MSQTRRERLRALRSAYGELVLRELRAAQTAAGENPVTQLALWSRCCGRVEARTFADVITALRERGDLITDATHVWLRDCGQRALPM